MKEIVTNKAMEERIKENKILYYIYLIVSVISALIFIVNPSNESLGVTILTMFFTQLFYADLKYWNMKYNLINLDTIMTKKEELEK